MVPWQLVLVQELEEAEETALALEEALLGAVVEVQREDVEAEGLEVEVVAEAAEGVGAVEVVVVAKKIKTILTADTRYQT